jgi:hypothetical protein
MYIKYLNHIPPVPENLLDSMEDIVTMIPEETVVKSFKYFQYKSVNSDLNEWVYKNFKLKCYAKYQVILNGIPIHKDNPAFPGDRRIAFNYLLQLGGDNVLTTVYDEDKSTILQEERLQLKRWHSLVVEKYHGVSNIENDKKRIALTVTPILKKI